MFRERGMIYFLIILLVIGGTALIYSEIKKIWDLQNLIQKLIAYFCVTFLMIYWISQIPIMDHIYDKNIGILEKYYLESTLRKGGNRDQYAIIIKNIKSGEIEKYDGVPVDDNYNLKKGMKLELYTFSDGFLFKGHDIAKIDGKITQYFIESYRTRPYEKEFAFSLISIYAVLLFFLTRKEYLVYKKQCGKMWYRLCIFGCTLYGSVPWIAYWNPNYAVGIRLYSVVILILLSIFELLFSRSIGMIEYQDQWAKRREEKKQRKVEEKQQFEQEMEEWEKKEEKKQLAIEMDRSEEHQFQQLNYSMTQQYCNMKFRYKMKHSMESVLLLGVLVAMAAFIGPLASDKLFAWYSYIAAVGVFMILLIMGVGYGIAYHKHKKFKEISASGKPLEYATVITEIGKEKRFLCSDGHEEVWRMEYDDDAEVKDGQEVVIIYIPSIGELMTEKPDILHKIFEG